MKKIITLMMILSLAFSSVNAVDSDAEQSDTEDTSVYQPGVASRIIGKAIVVGSVAVVGGIGYYIWKKLPGALGRLDRYIARRTNESHVTDEASESNQDLDSGADSPTNSDDTVDTDVSELSEQLDSLNVDDSPENLLEATISLSDQLKDVREQSKDRWLDQKNPIQSELITDLDNIVSECISLIENNEEIPTEKYMEYLKAFVTYILGCGKNKQLASDCAIYLISNTPDVINGELMVYRTVFHKEMTEALNSSNSADFSEILNDILIAINERTQR